MITILNALFFAGSVLAADAKENICADLKAYTCSKNKRTDGTGKDFVQDPDTKELEKLGNKDKRVAEKKFRDALVKDATFKQQALIGLGLRDSPLCKSPESEKCLALLSQQLSNLVYNSLFLPEDELLKADLKITGPIDYTHLTAEGQKKQMDLSALKISSPVSDLKKTFSREIQQKFVSQDAANNIETNIFPKVKQILLDKIDLYVEDPTTREILKKKIEAIKIQMPSCLDSTQNIRVDQLKDRNAQYFQGRLILYCGFTRKNQSEFTTVNTLAHEMTHAITPCHLTEGKPGETIKYKENGTQEEIENGYPIKGIVSCLRDEKSMAAKNWFLEKYKTENGGSTAGFKFTFCGEDQLGEDIPDWMAVEVLSTYTEQYHNTLSEKQIRNGYSNVWKFACHDKATSSSPSHADLEHRINALLLVNPLVRKQMGCTTPPKEHIYCPAKVNGPPSPTQNQEYGTAK
jgi:hypothetical protein